MTPHDTTFAADPLLTLPRPRDVRAALSRRLREADVLRRLLKVSERAASELADDENNESQAVTQ